MMHYAMIHFLNGFSLDVLPKANKNLLGENKGQNLFLFLFSETTAISIIMCKHRINVY